MGASEQDLELLELYLDHELAGEDVRQLDERLAIDSSLRGELDRLRGQRATRLMAMSTAFDTDAAAIERLVASVRVAQASEALQERRRRVAWTPMRSVLSAAACVAFGLLLGVTLQRQHGGTNLVASPSIVSTGSFAGSNVSLNPAELQPQGTYIVSLKDKSGREVMRVRFFTREHAQQFIDRVNNAASGEPPVVGDVRMLNAPY